MSLIRPFSGLCPAPGRASDVIAPPYDVLNVAEARELAASRPWSFLHISRPEIDLPIGTDPYAPEVYDKARDNLERMRTSGILVRDPQPGYYIYRLSMGQHRQTGLVAAASVSAYDTNRIRKHELTRPIKEDDRVRQIQAVQAQTGPVLLTYRSTAQINVLLEQISTQPPWIDVVAHDRIRHELWPVHEPDLIARITAAFDALPALYIADGHHRAAAASRVATERRQSAAGDREGFLSVLFPHDQMQILDYNRLIRDLHGLNPQEFLEQLRQHFSVAPSPELVHPGKPAEFSMYLAGSWYRLNLAPDCLPKNDPVARLDVSLLQEHVIGPLLGIEDPRRDERIEFVGGIRGLEALAQRVDSGEMAVAFALFPTRMDDLMDVADAGAIMPPKSTWFEPKLADGLVSLMLDER